MQTKIYSIDGCAKNIPRYLTARTNLLLNVKFGTGTIHYAIEMAKTTRKSVTHPDVVWTCRFFKAHERMS